MRFLQVAAPDRIDEDLVGHVTGFSGHLQVHARTDTFHPVDDGIPVRDHYALESPLLLQLAGEHVRRLSAVDALYAVVAGHYRPRLRLADSDLKGRHVDLVECPLIDVGIGPHPLGFDVVRNKVLQRCPDALGLHALDVGGAQFAGKIGVFGEVLEIPAPEGRALDVDAGAEQQVDAQRTRFDCQRGSDVTHQVHVPGGRQCRSGREAGGRQLVPVTPGIGGWSPSHSVRPVGHPDVGDIEAIDRLRAPGIPAGSQHDFFFQRHPREQVVNLVFRDGLLDARLRHAGGSGG